MKSTACPDCRAHSGIEKGLTEAEKEAVVIWAAIDKLRDRQWQILCFAASSALLALANIVILLVVK